MSRADDVLVIAGRLAGFDVHDVFDASREAIDRLGPDVDLVTHVESLLASPEADAAGVGPASRSRYEHAPLARGVRSSST